MYIEFIVTYHTDKNIKKKKITAVFITMCVNLVGQDNLN